jgi:YARHG domain/WG containing repeat
MKKITFFCFGLLCLLSACAGEHGPTESQKAQLAEQAASWANLYNEARWDRLAGIFDTEFDFNGSRMAGSKAVAIMQEFRKSSPEFEIAIQPNTWVLDSMRDDICAGHLVGTAYYDDKQDQTPIQVILWMKLPAEGAPKITLQHDDFGQAKSLLVRRYNDREMAGEDFDANGWPNITFWTELLEKIKPKLGQVVYCSKFEGRRLIYAKDKLGEKMGIYDQHAKAVLPCAYDDIGGIGIILSRAVEVQNGSKYGVVKMDGTTILPVEYDAILPAFSPAAHALWAQKDGVWMAFDSSGHEVEGSDFAALDWVAYLTELPKHLHGAPLTSFTGDDSQAEMGAADLFLPPFTLQKLGLWYATGTSLDEYQDGAQYSLQSVSKAQDGGIYFVSNFERWGIHMRSSYHNIQSEWIVFDPQTLDTLQKMPLYVNQLESYEWSMPCTQDNGGMSVYSDDLVEVWDNVELLEYSSMPKYKYYKILTSGKLDPWMQERDFAFMSIRKIDKDMLAGCFDGPMSEKEAMASLKDEVQMGENHRVAKFFRASDLDYLINEVYAAHGYIFEDTKWSTYYGSKKWYAPINADIEASLTPIEVANINFVKTLQAQMARDEEKYTQPEIINICPGC